MKIVALLPMRAKSERVVGKNFKDFCGKPLFKWMLDILLSLNDIDHVVINTDARKILAANGVTDSDRIIIRDRPSNICGGFVSMNKVIENDVDNVNADIFLMTHTTNPFLSKHSIERAIAQYKTKLSEGYDSLFTVNKIQSRFYDKDCNPINHDPDNLLRTQDLEPWFEENSNLYIFSRESFKKTNARIGKKPSMFVTDLFESTDIDTPSDWEVAIILAEHYKNKGLIT